MNVKDFTLSRHVFDDVYDSEPEISRISPPCSPMNIQFASLYDDDNVSVASFWSNPEFERTLHEIEEEFKLETDETELISFLSNPNKRVK